MKPFNRAEYDECDSPAKAALLAHLGDEWEVNPGSRYDADLKHKTLDKFCEVEIKKVWSGDTFEYDTIHLPQRKGKYLDHDITFYILNRELTHYVSIPGVNVTPDLLGEVPNKRNWSGEFFYIIPLTLCILGRLVK